MLDDSFIFFFKIALTYSVLISHFMLMEDVAVGYDWVITPSVEFSICAGHALHYRLVGFSSLHTFLILADDGIQYFLLRSISTNPISTW